MKALGISFLILRLSRVIADHAHHRDLLYLWCESIRQGRTIQLPVDQSFTPIAAEDLARVAVQVVDSDIRGIIHVAGPKKIFAPHDSDPSLVQ